MVNNTSHLLILLQNIKTKNRSLGILTYYLDGNKYLGVRFMYVYKCLWQNVRRDKISGFVQTFSNVTQVSGKIIYHYFKDSSLPIQLHHAAYCWEKSIDWQLHTFCPQLTRITDQQLIMLPGMMVCFFQICF